MEVSLVKINKQKVRKVRLETDADIRPIKGADLFPELYANIFCLAKKKSGKTSVIYKIIKECATRDTFCFFFVSTLHKDATWRSITAMCKKRKIPYVGYTSIKEDGVDQLALLLDTLKKDAGGVEQEEEEEIEEEEDDDNYYTDYRFAPATVGNSLLQEGDESDEEDEKPKKRKSKWRSPKYLIVADDISTELKNKNLTKLLKEGRHYQCKIIISSQWCNDIEPQARTQIDNWLVFKGQSEKKLEEIHRDCDTSLELEEFKALYKIATAATKSDPKPFLYYDKNNDELRRNFDKRFEIGNQDNSSL